MKQKVIVVTGGTKGLGLAIVKTLADMACYRVIAIGRTLTDDLKVLVESKNSSVFYEYFDFSNTKDIKTLSTGLTKKYGRIYGLVNNAALGHDGVLATMHEKEIGELIKVNVEAPILLTKYLIRSMLLNQTGRVINIASIIGSTGFSGLSVYGATKSALLGFTKSLSREVGKANITVNTVSPGYMQTAMTEGLQGEKLQQITRRSPLGRLADVDDVSDMVAFLLDEKTNNITGANFTVDAGSTA